MNDLKRKTLATIEGNKFKINGEYTYKGINWKGNSIEGLLLNSRMVQAAFDDRNPENDKLWAYQDTGIWDAERNTNEFIQAMPVYRSKGLLALGINLQGGAPGKLSHRNQTWRNSAFLEDGSLDEKYMQRIERIIDAADELGMVILLGYFYFGQERCIKNDDITIIKAVRNATQWILDRKYTNVMIEISNECNVGQKNSQGESYRYIHHLLQPENIHQLISMVQNMSPMGGPKLLVSTSYTGCTVPGNNVVQCADYILFHGNGAEEPKIIANVVNSIKRKNCYQGQPIVINEDDHYDFEKDSNNFITAIENGASWGYFDIQGYQKVPSNWEIDTERKKAFFDLLNEITGSVDLFF